MRAIVGEGLCNIVIVDDIMYYRSMRREVYTIAREQSYGFVTLYVSVPVEVALQRNAARESARVPEQVRLASRADDYFP